MTTEHPIGYNVEKIIGNYLQDGDVVRKMSTEILKYLDKERVLYYADPGRIQVMNNHGRVLLAILEDPGITQRALAVYLRVSESNVQKSLRMLLADGVIEKSKDGKRNRYKFNRQKGLSHPDVQRLLVTLLPLLSE